LKWTDRTNLGFHGNVHTQLLVRRKIDPDLRDKQHRTLYHVAGTPWLVFDPTGWITESGDVIDGRPNHVANRQRDIDGNDLGNSSDPEHGGHTETRYSGNSREQLIFNGPDLAASSIEHYDDQHRLILSQNYDARGLIQSEETVQYEGSTSISDYKNYESSGEVRSHWIDRVDQEEERFERSEYDPAGHMVSTITQVKGELADHWRDPNWHKPSTSAGLCEHFKKTVSFRFAADGALEKQVQHHDGRYGNVEPDDTEQFDSSGNLLEKIEFKYERDGHGNWTTRSVLIWDRKSNRLIEVERDIRTLTYYWLEQVVHFITDEPERSILKDKRPTNTLGSNLGPENRIEKNLSPIWVQIAPNTS
jgi:hypothetical protein